MFFEGRVPQDEAKIVPNRLLEPLSSDFGREQSIEKACREASRATRGAQGGRGAWRGACREAQSRALVRACGRHLRVIRIGILNILR